MTLMPPSVLDALSSRYAIQRELGQGGMATVFLAEDLKHHRRVALKVLKPELAAILGAERFLKEIEVTANLQHPNILPLYDSGEAAGYLYYVMPYIEGESLRDRLQREKQLPVDEALKLADAVGAALQFAHEHGVVHRDIKPENILLQAGQALVADFGIALAVSQAGGSRLTETGLSLGTPHYMSPEQATGDRQIDARSDIYALACVVYEMLVGEPPHLGNTVQAVVAKILTDEPEPITKRRKTVPLHVDAAVRKALAKLPADRFAAVADFRTALANASFTIPIAAAQGAGSRSWRTRVAVPMTIAAVVLGLLAAAGWGRRAPPPAAVVRLEVSPPDSIGRLVAGAVSPDGHEVLLTERMTDVSNQLFVRDLASLSARRLVLADPLPAYPAFSPDGKETLYLALVPGSTFLGRLKAVPLDGGPPRTLADSVIGNSNWGPDGYVYFSAKSGTDAPARIMRVPGAGGRIDTLVADDSVGLYQPVVLPDAEGAVAVARKEPGTWQIVVLDFRKRSWTPLTEGGPAVAVAPPDRLLFNRGRFLLAARLDQKQLRLFGPPIPVIETPGGELGWFAYRGGTLMHAAVSQGAVGGNVPILVDRTGRRRQLAGVPEQQYFGFPAVSPDGRKIAFRMRPAGAGDLQNDIWIYELPSGPLTRISFEGSDDDPSWTPDGRRILFDSDREGGNAIWITSWDGSGEAEKVLDRDKSIYTTSWLPDGRQFVFQEQTASGSSDIGVAVVGHDDSTRMLLSGPFSEAGPAVSPDGRWLAYQSNESGRDEIYLRPLQGEGTRRQVSRRGGNTPIWAGSGRELFFQSATGDSIMAARVDVDHDGAVEGLTSLFAIRVSGLGFDVFPGDSLFVVFDTPTGASERSQSAVVVYNFAHELESRLRSAGKR